MNASLLSLKVFLLALLFCLASIGSLNARVGSTSMTDYRVTFNYSFSWNDFPGVAQCPCNRPVRVCLRPDGSASGPVSDGYQTARSGDLTYAAGPSQRTSYILRGNMEGRVACLSGCHLCSRDLAGGSDFGFYMRTTEFIRFPTAVSTIQDLDTKAKEVNWHRTTDIPITLHVAIL